ncbi:MAG: phage holin family protein [Planctomycetales bacterium]
MAYQTPMSANGRDEPTVRGVAGGAADLWHHLLLLVELQMRLLAAELAAGIRAARGACLLMLIGGAMLLASLPVGLASLAFILAETMDLSLGRAFALTALIAALMAGALVATGWRLLKTNAAGIPRSRDEWRLNWSWLKETLRRAHSSGSGSREPVNGRV